MLFSHWLLVIISKCLIKPLSILRIHLLLKWKKSDFFDTPPPFFSYFELFLLFSHSVMPDSLWPMDGSMPGFLVLQYLEVAQTHVHWVGDVIQPSNPLSSPYPPAPQSLPASESFPMSQLFAWGGQNIGIWVSASIFLMNIQGWFPLGWTGWISLQSKGLSRVFSNTTV